MGVSRLDGKEDEIRFMSTRGLPKKLSSKQEWVGWAGSMGSTRGDRGVASSVSRFGEGPERFRNRSAQLIAEEVQLRAGLPPAG